MDNHRSHLPISLVHGRLQLQQKGVSVLIKTDFGMQVLYNWDDRVVVKLPGMFSGKVCGLCGNNNGNSQDDSLMPDGNRARDAMELGQSWKVAIEGQHCWDSCNGPCASCQWEKRGKYKGETSCGLLTQKLGPFKDCHDTVDPMVYLKNCIYTLCVNDGLHFLLCQALKAYADHCQEEGITVSDWRTVAHCRE